MDDTLVIRQQIEETKLQLTDKLESLEQQVSQTVQSAGDAVAATVEAVQETVESVTGAVEGAVHSVSEAFDLRQQIENHPFLVLGGAAALGYIAAECMTAYERAQKMRPMMSTPQGIAQPQATNPTSSMSPLLRELQTMAIGVLVGSIQGVALRALPEVLGAIMGNIGGSPTRPPRGRSAETGAQSEVSSDERPNPASAFKTRPNNFLP